MSLDLTLDILSRGVVLRGLKGRGKASSARILEDLWRCSAPLQILSS